MAIVGCGVIGETHADAIAEHPDLEVSVLVDPVREQAEALAKRLGSSPPIVSYLAEALDACDAVAICVPSGLHAVLAVQALEAGKHTVIEKPIDVDLDRARRIADAHRRSGVVATVISQHRYDPGSEIVSEAVASGSFGRITSGVATIAWWRSQAYYDSAGWRGTWGLDGGGALMNQGVHTLDLLTWFLGPAVTVSAQAALLAHQGIEVEDTVAATITFASGAIGSLLATTAAYPEVGSRLQVHGSLGSAVIEDDVLRYFHVSETDLSGARAGSAYGENQAPEPPRRLPFGHAHRRQYADFVHCIRTGDKPRVDVQDATETLALIRAVYTAAAENRIVNL